MPVAITSVLNRKNGFAQRVKLAQKLRCRKGTKSNFCDKVFIGFENHVRFYLSKYGSKEFITFKIISLTAFSSIDLISFFRQYLSPVL